DARVVLRGDPRHPAGLHEGEELVAAGVEEDVADLAPLLDLENVAADRLEPEDALVEVARPVQVERREADVGEASGGHGVSSLAQYTARGKRGLPGPLAGHGPLRLCCTRPRRSEVNLLLGRKPWPDHRSRSPPSIAASSSGRPPRRRGGR